MDLSKYRFSEGHIWLTPRTDGNFSLGVSDRVLYDLGELLFIDLPSEGVDIKKGEKIGEIEAVKAVVELIAPFDGKILEVNEAVVAEPKKANQDPFGTGYFLVVALNSSADYKALMDRDQYDKFVTDLISKRKS